LTILGPASYAQTQIWLDEQRRFYPDKPQVAFYNMPFLYRLSLNHILSIKQLRHALQLIIIKHQLFRTSLVFDTDRNQLMQIILNPEDDKDRLFPIIESIYETDEQLNNIMHDEQYNPELFDLAQGYVFRCHIVYHKQITSNNLLSDKDVLIFNFHNALFDLPSMDVFLNDLNQAYTLGQLSNSDNNALRYLDCKYEYLLKFLLLTYHFSALFRCCHRTTNADDCCKYVLARYTG